MKKIITFLTACIMAVGILPAANAKTSVFLNKHKEEQLSALGIMTSISAQENAYVTREKYSEIICKLGGSAQANMEKAVQMGLILPYDDGSLAPDANIRYDEAVRGLVIALGYDAQVEQVYGGSYIAAADAIGITQASASFANSYVSEKQLAGMVYESLDVPMMLLEYKGNGAEYSVDDNKTILSERFDVKRGKGRITSNRYSSLADSKGTSRDTVIIDGTLELDTGSTDAEFLLGYYSEFMYRQDDEDTLIWIVADSDKNSEIFIEGEDIVDYKNLCYTFEKDNREKSEALQSGCTIIYNGVAAAASKLTKSQMMPEYGEVTLLDADLNGKYDTVIIMDYKASVVDYTDTDKMTVSNKRNATYELEKADTVKIFNEKYKELALKDIKTNDVIWVAESLNGKYVTILVSSKSITGSVTATEKEYDEAIVTINGEQHKVDKALNEQYNFKLGSNGVFRLDILGNIIGYEPTLSDEFKIGYLLKGVLNENEEYPLILKILDDEDPHNYLCDNKIKLNGAPKNYKAALSEISEADGGVKKQLIRFKINAEGRINNIETAQDKPTTDGRMFKEAEIPPRELGAGGNFKAAGYYVANCFALEADAVVVIVPSDEEDYEAYVFTTPKTIKDDTPMYGVKAYKIDDNADYCIAAVWNNNQSVSSKNSPSRLGKKGILHSITQTIDENDEMIYNITYSNWTEKATITTDDPELVEGLTPGDIIRFDLDLITGEVLALTTDYDYSEHSIPSGLDTNGGYVQQYRISCGTVVKKQNNSIKISVRNVPSPQNKFVDNELLLFDKSTTYIVEKTRKGLSVRSGSNSEIRVGDRIVYTQLWGINATIFVYKF